MHGELKNKDYMIYVVPCMQKLHTKKKNKLMKYKSETKPGMPTECNKHLSSCD